MSEAVAEAAARTEAAAARAEEARARQEGATARWEATQADAAERNKKLDGLLDRFDKDREEEHVWRREYLRRQEKLFQEFFERAEALVAEGTLNTGKILAKIEDQGEDIRAMKDALLKLIDRLPPPPPHLCSA